MIFYNEGIGQQAEMFIFPYNPRILAVYSVFQPDSFRYAVYDTRLFYTLINFPIIQALTECCIVVALFGWPCVYWPDETQPDKDF